MTAVKALINEKSQEVARLRAELSDLRQRQLEQAEGFMTMLAELTESYKGIFSFLTYKVILKSHDFVYGVL